MQPSLFCTKIIILTMVLVVTHQISVRLRYVLHEIFEANHNIDICIVSTEDFLLWEQLPQTSASLRSIVHYHTNDQSTIKQEELVTIRAKKLGFTGEIHHLLGSGILEEQQINEQWREPGYYELPVPMKFRFEHNWVKQLPVLFPMPNSTLLFDPFSMIFWILSRYEEYFWSIDINKKSAMTSGVTNLLELRFSGKNSHAFRYNYLNKPIVDWVRQYLFCIIGIDSNEEHSLRKKTFQIIPTADIDMVFKFGKRPWIRNIGSWILSAKNPGVFVERMVSIFTRTDPYNPVNETLSLLKSSKNARCFLLLSNKHDAFHKQNRLEHGEVISVLKTIIQSLGNSNVGLHPSIELLNSEKPNSWLKEKANYIDLEGKQQPSISRFHYLFFHLPNHYQTLLSMGITEDWSMGYHDCLGFRAGTSFAFRWFNLEANTSTHLQVVSFQAMDVTCKNYLKYNSELSINYIDSLKQTIQSVGGDFIFVFHNESVSESRPWLGWKNTILEWLKQ
jgi:hypothetical protein